MRTSAHIMKKNPQRGATRVRGDMNFRGLVWTDAQHIQIDAAAQPPAI